MKENTTATKHRSVIFYQLSKLIPIEIICNQTITPGTFHLKELRVPNTIILEANARCLTRSGRVIATSELESGKMGSTILNTMLAPKFQ